MADIAKISLEIDSAPLARGVSRARQLLEELSGVAESAGRGVGGVGEAGRKGGEGLAAGAKNALQYAQALAKLEASQGNFSRATDILTTAQKNLTAGTIQSIRVQQQLAQVQQQAARSAELEGRAASAASDAKARAAERSVQQAERAANAERRAAEGVARAEERAASLRGREAEKLSRLKVREAEKAAAAETREAEKSAAAQRRAIEQAEAAQKRATAEARANAQAYVQLKLATGEYAAALRVLTAEHAKLEKGSTAALNAQRQIVQVQNQAKGVGSGKLSLAQDLGSLPGLGGLGRVANEAATVSRLFQGASASAGGLGVALGAVGAVSVGVGVGMIAAAKSTAAYAKEVEVAARATGLTTDAIQGLALEGRTIGADFHDIIDLVNQFSTQLGDARNGSKELQKVFKGVGIDAKTFGGDIFEAIDISIRALGKMPPGIQRTILASRQFGEEGARQILSMKNLEGGLSGLTAKYQAYGNVLSQQAIAESKKFNDELLRLELRLEGVRNKIGSAVLPAINDLGDTIKRTFSGESFQTFLQAINFSGSQGQGQAQRRLLGFPVEGVSVADGQFIGPPGPPPKLPPPPSTGTKSRPRPLDTLSDFESSIPILGQTFENAVKLAAQDQFELRDSLTKSRSETAALNAQLDILGPRAKAARDELEKLRDKLNPQQLAGKQISEVERREFDEAKKTAEELTRREQQLTEARRDSIVTTAQVLAAQSGREQLPTNLINFSDLFRSVPTADQLPNAITNETQRRAAKAAQAIEDARTVPTFREELFGTKFTDQSGNKRQTRGAADDFTEDFLRGLLSGRQGIREAGATLVGDFADFLGDFAARKINEVLRKQLENSFNALYDFLGGVLGKLFNSIKNKLVDPLGDFFGGLFSSFGGFRAAGGSVAPGKFYVVGEKGPELFASKSAGSIIPGGQSLAVPGGGPLNINVTFNGIRDVADFRRNSNEINRQIAVAADQGRRLQGAR